MSHFTMRSALAAIAIAAAALGSAATVSAAPAGGPCADVPYVGVCVPLRDEPGTPSEQGMSDVLVLPVGNGFHAVN
jgi:hypothetical protein